MPTFRDITGLRYGRLDRSQFSSNRQEWTIAMGSASAIVELMTIASDRSQSRKNGTTVSCGCARQDELVARKVRPSTGMRAREP